MRSTLLCLSGVCVAVVCLAARPARAQESTELLDIEVPEVVLDSSITGEPLEEDTEIDLANIVQSAARGVTTVQEAPAIVTVITEDEIEDRQLQTLDQI